VKAQFDLLRKYSWIFSPAWLTLGEITSVVAMSSPEMQSGTSGRKRRSGSSRTGMQERASPLLKESPPGPLSGPNNPIPPAEESSKERPAGTPSPSSSKKRNKSDGEGEGIQNDDAAEQERAKDRKDLKKKDPADNTAKGPLSVRKRAKRTQFYTRVSEAAKVAEPSKTKKVVVKGDKNVLLHHPSPEESQEGIEEDGRQRENLGSIEDAPQLAGNSSPKGKRKSGKRKKGGKPGGVQKAKTVVLGAGKTARLKGIFKRLLERSPPKPGSVDWQPEPELADSPNQAFVQNNAETAILDTLRGRAQTLDRMGSPLPITKLLFSLCSGTMEDAATVITLMTERFVRGIMREGPVWGLPREAVYAITRQPRTLPTPRGGAASPGGSRKGNFWRRGGKKKKGQGQQSGNQPKEDGSERPGKGKSLKKDKRDESSKSSPTNPKGTRGKKGSKGSRPPGRDKEKSQ